MYQYTEFDRQFVHARAAQFRDQLERNLAGELSDDDFRPLRLQNGWYIQRHAPMLRVAIPYGELASRQLRQLARIARELDRDFLHFTTRQNAQFNWIPIQKSADAMDLLAAVDMHGIQTSGNCIRNIMLRMQLPEVWMPCMSTAASRSIASADFWIGIQLNWAFWRVVKCRKSRSSSLAMRASWRSWRLASSP